MRYELKSLVKRRFPSSTHDRLRRAKLLLTNLHPRQVIHRYHAHRLSKLVDSGEVAIIPVGFRCFTKERLYFKLSLSQPSLPFDNGFFSPYSVCSILRNGAVDLKYTDGASHAVCIKYENYTDSNLGLGIKFQTSTYDAINLLAASKSQQDINRYLDTTFGYYTLDRTNYSVLAHYNWHRFADFRYSQGIADPERNLRMTSELMNRRIMRLIDKCESARVLLFVYDEIQGYNFMAIDDLFFDLGNIELIRDCVRDRFKSTSIVMLASEIRSPSHVMNIIKKSQ